MEKEFYGKYESILQDAMGKILHFAVNITNQKNYIEHMSFRLKNPESVKNKLLSKNLDTNVENAINELQDLAGVRLICNFISDIYIISRFFEEKFEVLTIKDYIKNPKPNGYRSYHMIVNVEINSQKIPVEIQIRTISQDSWASLEHKLKYKKDIKNEKLIRSELKRFADDMASTDLCMQTIKEFIEQS